MRGKERSRMIKTGVLKKTIALAFFSILSLIAYSAGKKEEKAAAAEAAKAQRESAYRADQIARKKAILRFPMIFVEGGSFTMGCTAEQEEVCLAPEKPAHPVFVRSYAICKYVVSQRQYREVMGKNPSDIRNDDAPVTNVSWNDAQKFITKLNAFLDRNFRLPTEAEWEYAARGGTLSDNMLYAGGNDLYTLGWYKDNSDGGTHPNGKRKANELGLYDMSGNVWEWCSDWYGPYPDETELEAINPTGAENGTEKVCKGGYYEGPALFCRVSCRSKGKPDYASGIIGLRLAEDRSGNEDTSDEKPPQNEGE